MKWANSDFVKKEKRTRVGERHGVTATIAACHSEGLRFKSCSSNISFWRVSLPSKEFSSRMPNKDLDVFYVGIHARAVFF